MRIISDHRDYYDCVMAQGMDLTCVWVRRLEEVEYVEKQRWRQPGIVSSNQEWPFPDCPGAYYRRDDEIQMYQYMIGFCGKVYPVLEISKGGSGRKFVCSLEEVDEFVEANFKKREIEEYKDTKGKGWRWWRTIGVSRKDIRKFFEECQQQQEAFNNIFVDNGCPVFVATRRRSRPSTIVYHGRREDPERPDDNPRVLKERYEVDHVLLKNFEFYKVINTQQAFQEIWQYISGILGLNNPYVPEMDDLTKRDIHGFDDWSFKKEPTKRKRK